ncbi:phosphoglycolate phosphatase [Rhodoligotrophos defluvii]|uniref:phosphoglycolate phosphatase n=1 Tax=Rhodoligotrophos defluvii TaxID=2561934 RepID=UPI0010C9B56F|nr:phosphoglycolate phosphatase [Rhodoligotrophos defluvii]
MHDLGDVSVVFDLDGTLVDTAPDLASAMNAVLRRHGRSEIPAERVRHMVGHGARALMALAFAETGRPAEEHLLDRLYDEFLSHYLDHIADESVLFPAATEALCALRDTGAVLGICTNKPEAAARQLLEALDFAEPFRAIIGGDSLVVKKPEPECYRAVVRQMGGDLARSVMVGDSETDVLTARAAGVPVIGVSFGYTPEPIASFKPDVIIDSYEALPDAVATVMRRGLAHQ